MWALRSAVVVLITATAGGCARSAEPPPSNTLVDLRDGASYPIVTVGKRRWLGRNLNSVVPRSWCYGDDPAVCVADGRLYSWDAARRFCPPGWRLPNDDDWLALIEAFGDSIAGRFATQLAGVRDTTTNGRSSHRGDEGRYWSGSNRGADSVSVVVFVKQRERGRLDRGKANYAASVRCVDARDSGMRERKR
jgi:hypothetical protein